MKLKMSEADIKAEWQYRFNERIGMLCGSRRPNEIEIEIAKKEADQWESDYRTNGQIALL